MLYQNTKQRKTTDHRQQTTVPTESLINYMEMIHNKCNLLFKQENPA